MIASMEKKASMFYVRLWILNVVPISITKDDARSLLLIFSNLMRIWLQKTKSEIKLCDARLYVS